MFQTSYIVLLCVVVSCCTGSVLRPDEKIYYGDDIPITEAPHMATLWGGCGAGIISEYYVLTAAHCVQDWTSVEGHSVGVGSELASQEKWYAIESFGIHELYGTNGADHDLAYIKLKEPLQFSDKVQKIEMSEEFPPINSTVYITGWGEIEDGSYPDQLRRLDMRVEVTGDIWMSGVSDRPGGMASYGDSGSPLTWNGKLVGIFSWITSNRRGGASSIPYFRNWIREKTGV